jgi:hypothetical protein
MLYCQWWSGKQGKHIVTVTALSFSGVSRRWEGGGLRMSSQEAQREIGSY